MHKKIKCLKIFKDGFSLIELIIGVALFTLYSTTIIFIISSFIRMEIRSKERLYETIDRIDKISVEYYIREIN